MKLVDFTDASTMEDPKVWVNPEHVKIVNTSRTGAMIIMTDNVVLVRESVQTVVHRLQNGGYDA